MFNLEKTLVEARMNGDYDDTQLVLSRSQLKTYTDLVVKQVTDVLHARFMGDHTREDEEVRRCITAIEDHFDTNRSG